MLLELRDKGHHHTMPIKSFFPTSTQCKYFFLRMTMMYFDQINKTKCFQIYTLNFPHSFTFNV